MEIVTMVLVIMIIINFILNVLLIRARFNLNREWEMVLNKNARLRIIEAKLKSEFPDHDAFKIEIITGGK